MDIDISVAKEQLDNELDKIISQKLHFFVWGVIFIFPIWAIIDYIYVPEYFNNLLILRLSQSGITLLFFIINSFLKRNIVLAYIAFFLINIEFAFLINWLDSKVLAIYFFQWAVVYLLAGVLILWKNIHNSVMLFGSFIVFVIFYFLFEKDNASLIFVNGGIVFIIATLLAYWLANENYEAEKRKIKNRLASDKAKSQLYGQNAQIKQQNEEIKKQKHEIEAQSEELLTQNNQITKQKQQLENTYQQITDSVKYAERIQNAVLGNPTRILKDFGEGFVFFKPKDIVSGDFYWYTYNQEKQVKILIVADCTGHGVPGAFMTLMGHNFLDEIVENRQVFCPNEILSELDKKIIHTLENNNKDEISINDGMDMAVLCFDEKRQEVKFAGAKNPLYFVRNEEIKQIKGSAFPIGSEQYGVEKTFELHTIKVRKGDIFYLSSDGFQDQFGKDENREGKFLKRDFRELLLKLSYLPLNTQKKELKQTFDAWRGNIPQTDDVLIIGVKI